MDEVLHRQAPGRAIQIGSVLLALIPNHILKVLTLESRALLRELLEDLRPHSVVGALVQGRPVVGIDEGRDGIREATPEGDGAGVLGVGQVVGERLEMGLTYGITGETGEDVHAW
jgi:hypothetical protein